MKKYILFILVLWGAYYGATRYGSAFNFLDFARNNPKDPWAESIDYDVGFLTYMKSDCVQSQKAFVQLLEDYPKTRHEESALFYLSDCARANMDMDTARLALQQYLQDFPRGPNNDVMQKRLEDLNNSHPEKQ
jgi:TolA-binding protein